ncbi:MAG TPA: AbrB/MazE/SpoVT family DNA-binding domain-containing protein [Alphaproteobacteria bacterium]|jgi:putative addiction module antidote|nr:AbrB/MazE/SpoVT family DNA-binding domain-containing protein [Alphaproteobacteria bacterium]
MHRLKLRRVGNSLGLTLPKEAVARLNVREGDELFLTEAPDGFLISPHEESFAAAMEAFDATRRKFRNALRALARGSK